MRRVSRKSAWLAAVLFLTSCVSPSYIAKRDAAVGLNGSFEIADTGYPVNWSFSGEPIRKGEAVVSLDTETVRDGRQSLRVEVLSTQESEQVFHQIWAKPSFSSRSHVEPGKQYRISFWYMNLEARLHVRWVTASSDYQQHFRNSDLLETDERIEDWRYVEDTINVQEGEHLLELIFVATQPGVFWCDDVGIEAVDTPR